MERKTAIPRRSLLNSEANIPKDSPETKASARLWPRIVIPVVVGSSPISHPIPAP